ncbi:Ig-like domain-containing protein [candidate division KSB1 bacterium]|nr:Ig-like domain-containing protein [candidate division KSB1 bacterium]
MSNKKACKMLPQFFFIIACSSLSGQTVISDSTYNPADWSVQIVTAFGASETHQQQLTGGNPGAFRYMEHILPVPPGVNDLTRVEVTHIYNGDAYLPFDAIDHIDYAEDIRLLNLQWDQAFIVSYPAIRQSGKFFRATQRLIVIADTLWMSGSLAGLKANDFIALDGSGDKPDFSDRGGFSFFGFWRISTRGATLPPIPPNQNLVYQHGSDNFTVTIHKAPSANQPPIARGDDYLYLDYFFNSNKALRVLENDFDPEGDPIRILSVDEPAFGGTIDSFNDTSITYSYNEPLSAGNETDLFLYKITDGLNPSLDAFVTMHFCLCPLECIALFLAPPSNPASKRIAGKVTAKASAADTLDVDLFRRFRDEALLPTETGTRFVDLYYHNAPEVMPLLLFDRVDIGRQALTGLTMIQSPLRNLLDGDGGEVITQALIDTITVFLDSLKAAVSDSLHDALQVELARLGPLQDLVGLPVAEAAEKALGIRTRVEDARTENPKEFVLHQNYPNPFWRGATPRSAGNPSTEIRYHLPQAAHVKLAIYNVQGREIKTLVDEFQSAGEKSVVWNGADAHKQEMTSGIYFYRLSTGAFQEIKKMILMR